MPVWCETIAEQNAMPPLDTSSMKKSVWVSRKPMMKPWIHHPRFNTPSRAADKYLSNHMGSKPKVAFLQLTKRRNGRTCFLLPPSWQNELRTLNSWRGRGSQERRKGRRKREFTTLANRLQRLRAPCLRKDNCGAEEWGLTTPRWGFWQEQEGKKERKGGTWVRKD